MLSETEEFTINGREYNFDYKEQANRTVILISSKSWDGQKAETIAKLRELLAVSLSVDCNPKLPRMLFVQRKQPDGNSTAISVKELRTIIKNCLDEL